MPDMPDNTKAAEMAIWKRLTDSSGNSLDINLDQVAFLRRTGSVTAIHFVGGETDQESSMTVAVKETPDEILKGGAGQATSQPFGFVGVSSTP
jgi:hypothetical protein